MFLSMIGFDCLSEDGYCFVSIDGLKFNGNLYCFVNNLWFWDLMKLDIVLDIRGFKI